MMRVLIKNVFVFGELAGVVHNIFRAELFGVYQLLLLAVPPLVVVVDNLAVITGLLHGRDWCTSPRAEGAALRTLVWGILDDIGGSLLVCPRSACARVMIESERPSVAFC